MNNKSRLTVGLLGGSLLAEEIELEQSAVADGVVHYRKLAEQAVKRGDGAALKPAERLLLHWLAPLKKAIRDTQREIEQGRSDTGRSVYGPVLMCLDADELAVITMHEALGELMMNVHGCTFTSMSLRIGNAVLAEINARAARKGNVKEKKAWENLTFRFRSLSASKINWWAKKNLGDAVTDTIVKVQIGMKLFNLLRENAVVPPRADGDMLPAFEKYKFGPGHKKAWWVQFHWRTHEIIEEGHDFRSLLRPRYLPMLVPPYPWHADRDIPGGYIQIRTPYISKPSRDQKEAMEKADLEPTNLCVNALASTAWRNNQPVLEMVREVWENGGEALREKLDIPLAERIPLPAKPEDIETNPEALKRWKRAAHDNYSANIALESERKTFIQRLGVAERFKDRLEFYYPCQLDFRTRAYPVPPHLNHQGPDLCRGLLEFGEGKPIGDHGMRSLAIEAANCWGHGIDKMSYDRRVEWVMDHMKQVVEAVSRKLDDDWWMGAKKPWQFWAACNALVNEDAGAHACIRRDGSCNGLQHYAALGRDASGAALVNMLPGDEPRDIYTTVCERAIEIVKGHLHGSTETIKFRRQSPEGVEHITMTYAEIAPIVLPHICRDVVKPNVMTRVYGVTRIGANDQIWEGLEKLGVDTAYRYPASEYLQRCVKQAIGELCVGANAIMEWLTACAKAIAKSGELVRWTTPLGFPVVQPYRRLSRIEIKTEAMIVNVMEMLPHCKPAPGQQSDGCAPNFIHSIDATNLLTAARDGVAQGITIAGVHDSYWTHAGTEPQMNRLIREKFVELHRRDILGDLHSEWNTRHPEVKLPPPPPKGDFDLEAVLSAPYCFG